MSLKDRVRSTAAALSDALTVPVQALGLDLDGVIDESASFFSVLSRVWPGEVYVFTYRDDRAKVLADLDRYGIRYADAILVDSFADKAAAIARLGIGVYVDDQDEVLMHVPEGVTVLKLRNGGNYDYTARKWLYSAKTGRSV